MDDDPDVRDSLGRALRCAGYAVTTAVHGADALDSLARRPVDLIVLDVLMPIVDGFDACRRLRERGTPPDEHLVSPGHVQVPALCLAMSNVRRRRLPP